MNYTSQEEHDHFEGAAEQSVPQRPMTYTDKIDEMVRDFCSIIPKSKSEVRQRIVESIHQAIAEERVRCNLPEIRVSSLSLLLDDCPNCGQVVNRSFVDNLTCRIQDEYKQKILASLDKPLSDN